MSDRPSWRAQVLAGLDLLERELDERNAHPAHDFEMAIARLRRLITDGRRGRVGVIGRRGAGKSSLLNALTHSMRAEIGDVEDSTTDVIWHDVTLRDRRIDWADSPGLRAGGKTGRRETVAREFAEAPPDVILVLCQASEVDAGIDADLADVSAVMEAVRSVRGESPKLIAVVTKVDELAPADVTDPPFDDREKRQNIQRAVTVLGAHFARVKLRPIGVVPVASYVRFGSSTSQRNICWNIEALALRIVEALPTETVLATKILGTEIQSSLSEVMDSVIDSFSTLARAASLSISSSLEARVADVSMIEAAMLRILHALAAHIDQAPQLEMREGPLDVVRAALGWLRADRASARIASLKVRTAGSSVRRRAINALSTQTLATLLVGKIPSAR